MMQLFQNRINFNRNKSAPKEVVLFLIEKLTPTEKRGKTERVVYLSTLKLKSGQGLHHLTFRKN